MSLARLLAPEHLQRYIVGPDSYDPLLTAVVWLLIVIMLAVDNFTLKRHALPKRMFRSQESTQLQLVTLPVAR